MTSTTDPTHQTDLLEALTGPAAPPDEASKAAVTLAERIAARAKVTVDDVTDVFTTYGLPLVLTPSRPRSLQLVRLRIAGERVGQVAPGPFDTVFRLGMGLTALVASNLRGKTSVLEFITWVLRGTPADLQAGPKSWARHLDLDVVVAGQPLGFRLDLAEGAITRATILTAPGVGLLEGVREADLDAQITEVLQVHDDASYAAEAAALMMDRLDLSPIVNTFKETRTQTHHWPTYFGAIYLGSSPTNALLGEHTMSGQAGRLLQIFLDLPAAAALTRVKTNHDVLKNSRSARDAAQEQAIQSRATERAALETELADQQARLSELTVSQPSDHLPDLARRAAELASKVADARQVDDDLTRELALARAARLRAAKHVADLSESGIARALFHGLDPTSCPRCDQAITSDRRRQEHAEHSCAVCVREVPADDAAPEDVIAEAEALHDAARQAERQGREDLDRAAAELQRLLEDLVDVDARLRRAQGVAALPEILQTQTRIHQLEGALSVMPATAATKNDGGDPESRTLRVLAAAQKILETENKTAAEALFDKLNEEIAALGRRFGIDGLEKVRIDRGARLRVIQDGGTEQWFSDCVPGVQLRLRIAVVIALLRVGKIYGVATHPGLLMIDSPKREELQDLDATPMFKELAAVATKNGIQILTTTRDYDLVHSVLDPANVIEAPEGEPLW